MVRLSTRSRSAETGVRRSDGGDDQHGAPLQPAPARPTSALRCSAWALQSDHLRIRPAPERRHRAQGLRPRHERRDVRSLARAPSPADFGGRRHRRARQSQGSQKPESGGNPARKNCTVRYLPPYSPDFNPIEMAISKLKSALRKLAERTVVGLLAILEGCATLFKPAECENYFEACGYDPGELQALNTT